MRLALALVASIAAFATGCDTLNCQSTCNRLYQESECNIGSAGVTRDDLVTTCLTECEAALDVPGDVGDYAPDEYVPANESVTLENDKQAALWMECIDTTDCKLLEEGHYCAPIW